MNKTKEAYMEEAIRKLLEIIVKEAAGNPIRVESITINGEEDICKGIEEVMAYDDTVSISCVEKHIWFCVFTGNEPDELIVDYSDNEVCNQIADKWYKEFNK